MNEMLIAVVIFLCLAMSSLGCLAIYERLPARYRGDDTQNVVRLVAGIFSVMTSLLLGLMINSAKNTLESVDRNIHAFATGLIVLDRTLREYGPEAMPAREHLLKYAQRAARGTQHDDPLIADRVSEGMFYDVSNSLKAIEPRDRERMALWQGTRQQHQKLLELRWVIVEQSEGTIPAPILVMLVAWLMLIFASFGFRAPRNAVVISSFLIASALIAAAIYLIIDMDAPFAGPIQVSSAPLERAVAEMER
jgi:hypothetical protein